ncbi:tyrosine-type recombinase/integrase [Maribacter sp. 2308TA10-17]|uniref:tyrosine-type recombinase/integrase n=1 Tax=Maribacter sp. 2308TA10-17 TaxID=3386276 RepID=UPI0039BD3ED2
MTSKTQLVLRKKPNKQGLYPLAVRITKNRKSNYYFIGHYIELRHWDDKKRTVRKSHPDADMLNKLLITRASEANRALIELQSNRNDISSIQIKREITNTLDYFTFWEVAEEYLQELKSDGKLTRYYSDKVRINHVVAFFESKELSFPEIDEVFLRRFRLYLKNKRNLSERSVVNNFVVIRTLYNRAIGLGIIDKKNYPFGKGKIAIRFPETEKIGLTIEEIQRIERISNLSSMELHSKNIWLFCFYLAGIRVGDVLKIKWSDIYDGRIHYRMNKNSKLLSLKLPKKLIPILSYYQYDRQHSSGLIFPELKKADLKNNQDIYTKTRTATKKFNKYLKKIAEKANIDKKITMHIARHSFGNIAGDKIPVQLLQKLYRHSSITTTMQYQSNFMTKETDEALDNVVGF